MIGEREIGFVFLYFITNTIMAVTGFAGTMLAMPASILLLGVKDARFLLNVLAILSCGYLAVQQWKYANKQILKKIIIVMLVGMAIGTMLYRIVPINFLLPIYGAVVVALALKHLFFQKECFLPSWVYSALLVIAGVIHGMFVSGGALLVLYVAMVLKDKDEFRATVAATWAVLDPTFFALNFDIALWNAKNLLLIALCLIPMVISVRIGNWLHDRMNKELFLKLTYILLLMSGLSILL